MRLDNSGGELESYFVQGQLEVVVPPGVSKFSLLVDCQ